jgi:hypothetical protein
VVVYKYGNNKVDNIFAFTTRRSINSYAVSDRVSKYWTAEIPYRTAKPSLNVHAWSTANGEHVCIAVAECLCRTPNTDHGMFSRQFSRSLLDEVNESTISTET